MGGLKDFFGIPKLWNKNGPKIERWAKKAIALARKQLDVYDDLAIMLGYGDLVRQIQHWVEWAESLDIGGAAKKERVLEKIAVRLLELGLKDEQRPGASFINTVIELAVQIKDKDD